MARVASARTTIVTVSFNSAAVLPTMLASVPAGTPVIVVDNASSDTSADIATARGATLVRMERNEGFGRACNAGARLAETDFLLFLNPDAALETGALSALEDAADAHPKASAFNPKILTRAGASDFKRRSVLLPRSSWLPRGVPDQLIETPVLSGAAFFCRRACFEQVGGFDPAIFLYHEDDDLSIRMAKACGPLLFVPEAVVRHMAGHGSARSAETARFKGFHMARSRYYAQARHGLARPWLFGFLGSAAAMLAPHILFSRRRRAKQLGQIAGMWSARGDGGAYL